MKSRLNIRNWYLTTPFKWAKSAKTDNQLDTIIIGITYARLSKDKALRKLFFNHVRHINTTLANTDGYIGSAIRMQPFGDKAWTVSAWKDEASMKAFVYGEAHAKAMQQAGKAMLEAQLSHHSVSIHQLPLPWTELTQRLKQANQ